MQEIVDAIDMAVSQNDMDLRKELQPILQEQQDEINELYASVSLVPHYEGMTIIDVLVAHEQQIQFMWQTLGMDKVLQGYPPTPAEDDTEKFRHFKHENRQVSQSVSQTFSQSVNELLQVNRQFKPTGRPTDGRLTVGDYDEYKRLCRKSKIPVDYIAAEIGTSKSGVERRITKLKERGAL